MFEHSQKGVKVQKKNLIPEFVPTMLPQIGSFSIVRKGCNLSLLVTHSLALRPQRNTEGTPAHRRMAQKWVAISTGFRVYGPECKGRPHLHPQYVHQ
jgi:hypothetical protein